MKERIFLLFLIQTAGIAGCASIVTGQNQSISVETRHQGRAVSGASCKLNNDKGTWFLTSPGSVTVQRSHGDLSVLCEKEKFDPGIVVAKSFTKGMAFGNILFGGIIGGAVDMSSGAAYDYPSLLAVELGRNITIDPSQAEADAATTGR